MGLNVDVLPLPKKLYDDCKAAGVTKIFVHLSGGSDQGYCDGDVRFENETCRKREDVRELVKKIMEWADENYGDNYCGAGDGSDYGDDIEYDLVDNTVYTSQWYTARFDSGGHTQTLKIADSDPSIE